MLDFNVLSPKTLDSLCSTLRVNIRQVNASKSSVATEM